MKKNINKPVSSGGVGDRVQRGGSKQQFPKFKSPPPPPPKPKKN